MVAELVLWSEASPFRSCRCGGRLLLQHQAAVEVVGAARWSHSEARCSARSPSGAVEPLFPGESDAEVAE